MSGVPNGESYWGPEEDRAYFGNLYAPCDIGSKFDIRLRQNGRGNYAYYHYLVYNTINDYDGRDGSYLGITLRLDQYCTDFQSIYYVLDMVFRKRIIGSLLKLANGGRLQYNVHSFDIAAEELTKLETVVKDMLSPVLQKTDISSISRIPNGKNRYNLNIEEATIAEVTNIVGQNGFCSLAPEYMSRKEERHLAEQYDNGCRSRQGEIDSLNNQLSHYVSKQKELEASIDNLKNSKPSVQQRVVNGAHHESHHESRKSKGSSTFNIINIILTALCLLLLIYSLWFKGVTNNVFEDENVIKELSEVDSNSDFFAGNPSVPNATIKIEGYNEEEGLNKDEEYDVILENFEGYKNLQLISSDNCDIIRGENDKLKIKVKDSTGEINLACVEDANRSVLLQKIKLKIKE